MSYHALFFVSEASCDILTQLRYLHYDVDNGEITDREQRKLLYHYREMIEGHLMLLDDSHDPDYYMEIIEDDTPFEDTLMQCANEIKQQLALHKGMDLLYVIPVEMNGTLCIVYRPQSKGKTHEHS